MDTQKHAFQDSCFSSKVKYVLPVHLTRMLSISWFGYASQHCFWIVLVEIISGQGLFCPLAGSSNREITHFTFKQFLNDGELKWLIFFIFSENHADKWFLLKINWTSNKIVESILQNMFSSASHIFHVSHFIRVGCMRISFCVCLLTAVYLGSAAEWHVVNNTCSHSESTSAGETGGIHWIHSLKNLHRAPGGNVLRMMLLLIFWCKLKNWR